MEHGDFYSQAALSQKKPPTRLGHCVKRGGKWEEKLSCRAQDTRLLENREEKEKDEFGGSKKGEE